MSFSPAPNQEDTPALRLARFVWSHALFPVGNVEHVQPQAFADLRRWHSQLSQAGQSDDLDQVHKTLKSLVDDTTSHSLCKLSYGMSVKGMLEAASLFLENPDQKFNPIPPLEPSLIDEAQWFLAGLSTYGFTKISVSPFAITPASSRFFNELSRVAGTLNIPKHGLGLQGELALAICPYKDENTCGVYTPSLKYMKVYSDNRYEQSTQGMMVFAHEWMHALEDISNKTRLLSALRPLIRQAGKLLKSMPQDSCYARQLIDRIVSDVENEYKGDILYLLETRGSAQARSQLIVDGQLCPSFSRSFVEKMLNTRSLELREKKIASNLGVLLGEGQAPPNPEAVRSWALFMETPSAVLRDIHNGVNLFYANSRYADHQDGRHISKYWSSPSEMLARAFEVFILPELPSADFLEGRERDDVFEAFSRIGATLSKALEDEPNKSMASRPRP